MSDDDAMLQLLATKAVTSTFLNPAYRSCASDIPGTTLETHLVRQLLPEFREWQQQAGILDLRPAMLAAFRSPNPGQAGVLRQAYALVQTQYAKYLVTDLLDPASPRYEPAKLELWLRTELALKKGRFYGNRQPAFVPVMQKARMAGFDPGDVLHDFWEWIWPSRIPGNPPRTDHRHTLRDLQIEANGFLSHRNRDFTTAINRTVRQRDRDEADGEELVHKILQHRTTGMTTEHGAIDRIMYDTIMQVVLKNYGQGSRQNPLGLLTYLFKTHMIPNVTGVRQEPGAENVQIASVLEAWADGSPDLGDYLTTDPDGPEFDNAFAAWIIDVIAPGFASARRPITDKFVTTLYSRFRKAVRTHLQNIYDDFTNNAPDTTPPPGDDPPDRSTPAHRAGDSSSDQPGESTDA